MADRLVDLAPLLFAVTVLTGIGVSLIRLVGTPYPALTIPTTSSTDAAALFLGQPLYQDPASGYTGALYTPLYPTVVSLLDRIHYWHGWAPLLNIAATLALVALAARLAFRPAAAQGLHRFVRIAQALGIGALCWWFISRLKFNYLYDSRQDHLAWALALIGLSLTPAAMRGRLLVQATALVLLSAAFWAKQTTAAAALAAVIWIVLAASGGQISRARAAGFIGALAVVNLGVLGVLNLLTSGWEWYFNFSLPARQAQIHHGLFLRELARVMVFPVAVAVVLWIPLATRALASAFKAPLNRRELVVHAYRSVMGSKQGQIGSVLTVFAVVGVISATYFRRKQGSDDNQYIGVVWAVGLLGALGYQLAGASVQARRIAGMGIAAVFAVAVVGHRLTTHIPTVVSAHRWSEVPAELVAYGRTHLVYDPMPTDLTVQSRHTVYPSAFNVLDLLGAGQQPKYLITALLDRRFDAVGQIPIIVRALGGGYSWSFGKWEENYLWKMERVMSERYAPGNGAPKGFLARRAGPERASWMRYCFGPFTLGGLKFRIHQGGGFWCRPAGGGPYLSLVETPAPVSNVVTTTRLHSADGTLTLTLPRPGGSAELGVVSGSSVVWNVRLMSSGGANGVELETSNGRVQRAVVLPHPRRSRGRAANQIAITIHGSTRRGFRLTVGRPGGAPRQLRFAGTSRDVLLRLQATSGSGARYGFADLRLR